MNVKAIQILVQEIHQLDVLTHLVVLGVVHVPRDIPEMVFSATISTNVLPLATMVVVAPIHLYPAIILEDLGLVDLALVDIREMDKPVHFQDRVTFQMGVAILWPFVYQMELLEWCNVFADKDLQVHSKFHF